MEIFDKNTADLIERMKKSVKIPESISTKKLNSDKHIFGTKKRGKEFGDMDFGNVAVGAPSNSALIGRMRNKDKEHKDKEHKENKEHKEHKEHKVNNGKRQRLNGGRKNTSKKMRKNTSKKMRKNTSKKMRKNTSKKMRKNTSKKMRKNTSKK